VRVLIDDVGSRYTKPSMVGELRDAGVPAAAFLPTRVPRLFQYANLRNTARSWWWTDASASPAA